MMVESLLQMLSWDNYGGQYVQNLDDDDDDGKPSTTCIPKNVMPYMKSGHNNITISTTSCNHYPHILTIEFLNTTNMKVNDFSLYVVKIRK